MFSQTRNPKVSSLSLGPARIVSGGSECPALSPPSIHRLRCPWARHWTPGCRSIKDYPLLRVCVCVCVCVCALWMGKMQSTNSGHHTWLYVTSLKKKNKFLFFFLFQKWQNADINGKFKLPMKNEFIPTNFEIYPLEKDSPSVPTLIKVCCA